MGMFDTVVIEGLKLPKLPKEINDFLSESGKELPTNYQTKDLNNAMSTFSINKNGQVFETIYKPTGKKIKHELPFKNWTDNRSYLERLYWNLKFKSPDDKTERLISETKPVKVKVKFTNTFSIYTYEQINGRYLDLEYNIVVNEGRVKAIKLNKWGIENKATASKRRKEDEDFQKKMDDSINAHRLLRSRWYYPALKEIVNPSVFFTRLLTQKLCNKLITWSYRWHGV
jgi:hypothetical protein